MFKTNSGTIFVLLSIGAADGADDAETRHR